MFLPGAGYLWLQALVDGCAVTIPLIGKCPSRNENDLSDCWRSEERGEKLLAACSKGSEGSKEVTAKAIFVYTVPKGNSSVLLGARQQTGGRWTPL